MFLIHTPMRSYILGPKMVDTKVGSFRVLQLVGFHLPKSLRQVVDDHCDHCPEILRMHPRSLPPKYIQISHLYEYDIPMINPYFRNIWCFVHYSIRLQKKRILQVCYFFPIFITGYKTLFSRTRITDDIPFLSQYFCSIHLSRNEWTCLFTTPGHAGGLMCMSVTWCCGEGPLTRHFAREG